jgi:oxygen-independent coproporphyrinogen-3 oxidase
MDYILEGHSFSNALIDTVQIFYPNEKYRRTDKPETGRYILSRFAGSFVETFFYGNDKVLSSSRVSCLDDISHSVKLGVYQALSQYTGYKNPWGILTGIRPAKIAGKMLNEGKNDSEIISYLSEKFLVNEDKIQLSIDVAKAEFEVLKLSKSDKISIYIGIPFCPTRCLYCSFTSYPVDRYKNRVETYVNTLISEIKKTGEQFDLTNVENIYIGGGTPTSIDYVNFEKLLSFLCKYFDINSLREFTVEAGRPDTITKEKLSIMKNLGVSRISVNPQTVNDKTLKLIGRNHTAADFFNAYNMACNTGFDNINIDLILGLNGESEADVLNTFSEITALNPNAVTVHTLSVKRASRLKEEMNQYSLTGLTEMENMLKISAEYMESADLKPYYMYRQKNMLGNFENVGYTRLGYTGVYNIQIMEEKQHIFAFGAGSVSKFVDTNTNRIERAFNVKSIEDYLNRADDMVDRKVKAFQMLNK